MSSFLAWKLLNPVDLFQGADNRPSSSKLQFFLWTVAVIACFSTVYFRSLWGQYDSKRLINLPVNLMLVMGFSITTAVGAKAITVSYLKKNSINKNQASDQDSDLGQVVKDDSGVTDLTKFQMLSWTFIGIGTFGVNVYRMLHNWPKPGADINLPDVDQALMVLMGFGNGTYLGKKLILNTSPTLTRAVTPSARGGSKVTLAGTNLGNSNVNNQITLDGVSFDPMPEVKSWADDSIVFVFPEASKASPYEFGRQKNLGVIIGGHETNTVPIAFAKPEMRRLTRNNNIITLSGTGFGGKTANAALSAVVGQNAIQLATLTWEETAITFEGLELPDVQRAVNAKLSLRLDVDWTPVGPRELVVEKGG